MIQFILHWVLSALVVMAVAYVVPGIHVDGFTSALWAAVAMGIVNSLIKPIVGLLSLPLTILTLGLFAVVINAGMFGLAAYFVKGFTVAGFIPAVVGSLLLAVLNGVVGVIEKTTLNNSAA